MRKLCIFVLGLFVTGGITLAQAPTKPGTGAPPPTEQTQTQTYKAPVEAATFIEAAVIDGGENARNGDGDGHGVEVVGIFGFSQVWYAGGILGRYETDLDPPSGDIEDLYLNLKIGRIFSIAPRTISYLEAGLWFGDHDIEGPPDDNTDPRALELKVGFVHAVSAKVDLLGSLSWIHADLDNDDDDDDSLRNYQWSAGAGYKFGEMFSMNLRIIDGFNGVNGQDQVLRLAGRWTF